MLKLDLIRLFEDKGIENPSQFLKKNGLTAHTVSRLLNNKVESISFKHLETICLLLNCTIDDLFAWENNDKSDLYKDHSLQKLKRGKKKGNIVGKLKNLPADKLSQVRDFIEELSKK
ncbi:MAG: helix-turn-helix transcriptional regulator [Cyclobacteriaceae bacterium]|jgi:DNA-binding Xre family transcriptional regulator|nr:helix-turn-helix transcriptional regulator [Cyclobacteriaceae bacterium]